MQAKDRIVVALDVDHPDKAIELVEKLASLVGCFKVGLEFITSMIASIITASSREGAAENAVKIRKLFQLMDGKVFWDGKLDDIPNTVGGASKAISTVNVRMFNVHASAGIEAMRFAAQNKGSASLLAVTVLTSIDDHNSTLIFGGPAKAKVLQFARDARVAGCDGIVCSPQELLVLDKQRELGGLRKVIPGIRSSSDPVDDQKRTLSSGEAIIAGADELVIGRPITKLDDPAAAAERIAHEIEEALPDRLHSVLFDLQKIKFGAFKLKLHEQNPSAPLSPIYLNIRDLPDWVYTLAGDILHDLVVRERIREFDYVIGIPKAGEPIGKALAKALGKPHLRIEKIEESGGRKITSKILDPFQPGKRVLLVDDLVTKAGTKREAIQSIEANDLNVEATVVLYDREQGGLIELNKSGCPTFAATRLSRALLHYVKTERISSKKADEVMEYVKSN